MHRTRHTFASEMRRVAGVGAASQALGHSDLSTTLGIYCHQDQRDLEQAMELLLRRETWTRPSLGNGIRPPGSTECRDLQVNGRGGNRIRARFLLKRMAEV